ncbi:MAG: tetratricopeptide repeat protein [Elusimicrobia bacterium]|nr:tetratricopeptide repeat protein [Elusimicrobiota bacterium]
MAEMLELVSLEAELEALGFDGEAENVRCLAEIPREAGGYEEALSKIARFEADIGGCSGDLAALKGKVLMCLGRFAEARTALSRASPTKWPVHAWLGQCLILSGKIQEAAAILDQARRRRPDYPWVYFFRACVFLASGEHASAERESAAFLKTGERASAHAVRALAQAQAGRLEDALASMARCRRLGPGEEWALALSLGLCQRTRDFSGARRMLEEAAAAKPSAWTRAELAKVFETLGMLPQAIENADEAARLKPSPAHHALKARLHVCWREYALAAEEYGRALALDPGNTAILFDRSKAYSAGGDLAKALQDGEISAAANEDPHLKAWRIQLLILLGRARQARAETASLLRGGRAPALDRALARFCLGYLELCAGRFKSAGREFLSAERLAEGSVLSKKASFYRAAAGVFSAQGRARPGGGLSLIGLGVDPPYTASSECLREIRACDVVFNNVMGDEMFEFLRPFCRDSRPLAYHQNADEGRLSDEIMAEVRLGKAVGFVTRGNALIYGPLGSELMARCRRAGVSCRCLPAVSSGELFAAKFAAARPWRAAAVMDSSAAGEVPDSEGPLTVFLDMRMSGRDYEALCRRLAASRGPERRCLVFDHVVGQEPLACSAAELAAMRARLSPSAIFHIP